MGAKMSSKGLRKGLKKNNMLDKKAAKMVEEVRLQTIEKEYKSSGTLLDTRHLFRLDDTNAGRERAQAKLDIQKRVDSRRGARGHDEIKRTAEATIDKMIAKGDAIVKTSNFDNEELIWATKSSDPNYVKKRKYDDPELHKFKMNMDPDQKKVYKVSCQEALIDLATRYREEMNAVKAEMDLSGVFHPDANAHRAHCMYLMRLYNHITADTIEDPVLRKMRSDIEGKERAVVAEERRQRRLISQIERKNKKESEEDRLAREAEERAEDEQVAREERERMVALKGTSKRSARASLLELAQPKHPTSKRASLIGGISEKGGPRDSMKRSLSQRSLKPGGGLVRNPTMHGKSHPGGKDTLAAFGDGHTSILDDDQSSRQLSSAMEESSVASSSVSGMQGDEAELGKGISAADQKLFTKMKRNKLGHADASTVLAEEAKRLQEAEVTEHKKPWDRSGLVGAKVGEWMMGLLQGSQISRTGEGSSNAPEATGLLPTGSLRNDSMDSPTKRTRPPGGGEYDPQLIVPFQDFNAMFQTFSSEMHQQEEEEAKQRELQRQEEELLEQQRLAQEEEEEEARKAQAEAEASLAGEGEEDAENGKGQGQEMTEDSSEAGVETEAEEKQAAQAEEGEGEGEVVLESGVEVMEQLLSEMMLEAEQSGHGTGIATWQPTDTLALLEEADPQYQAYIKMMRRQNPAGRRLFRGKSSKKAKGRPAAPLGQKAVTMLDSRGASTADASKGFKNVFREAHAAEDGDTDDDDDDDDEDLHSHVTNDSSTIAGEQDTMKIDLDGPTTATSSAAPSPDKAGGAEVGVTSGAKVTTTSPVRAGRSPSRGGSRGRTGSRGRRRNRPGSQGKGGTAGQAEEEEDMQKKLMQVFDCLQVPAMSRLSFMRKFAGTRATQFNLAIDLFGEAAVLVLARQHVVHRSFVALKEGFAVLPLIAERLSAPFRDSVPKILTSRGAGLSLQNTHSDTPMDPLSARMYASMEDLLHSMFPNDRVHDAPDNMMTPESAKDLLYELEQRVEVLIDDVKARIADQLSEPLEMNGEDVDAWLKKLKRIVDPPAPKPIEKEGGEGDGEKKKE